MAASFLETKLAAVSIFLSIKLRCMKEFWNERYSEPQPAYGTRPNVFIQWFIDHYPPGKILFPAEGQGRNAVYAAEHGWEVDAFDYSEVARTSAINFAALKDVSINYWIEDLFDFSVRADTYDAIALCYVHVPLKERALLYAKFVDSLKVGGHIVMEVFTKTQLAYTSGGPKSEDLLFDSASVLSDFQMLETVSIEEKIEPLAEGKYHVGDASILRYIGKKIQ